MTEHQPVKRGRKPKAAQGANGLPVVEMAAVTLWSLREVAKTLRVGRKTVDEAVISGRLPCEPATRARCVRRVLAADAVRVLAPAFLSRIKFL